MQYRKFGKIDAKPSLLGFGCMRLPVDNGDVSKIKEKKAIEIIRYGIDNGINYIDTAYPYHQGNSEILVGKALKDGYREKVYLATKLPVWQTKTYGDFEKYLDEQLKKLQTDYIDFYLLHALNVERWTNLKKLNVINFLENMVKKGKIKYFGFSFHDELNLFKEIVDYYPWDFCQIQLNYMDQEYQAGMEGLKYASERGLGIIIMEPLKGGKLVSPPDKIKDIWEEAKIKRTPAEWAFRWLYNMPEISLVLSGMSSLDEVIENISIASNSLPDSLTKEELNLINKVKDAYIATTKVGCTDCGYCMPCPVGVDIPKNFSLYNDILVFGDKRASVHTYNYFLDEEKRASACIECRKCEAACPQNIEISKYLKDVHKHLAK